MDVLLLFAAGFAPGVFWLWYFYRKDKYEPEPQRLVLRTAGFGVLAAVPVAIVGEPFNELFFVAAVIVAPIIEELAKFAVVRFTIYNNREFNEPMDGIVYAAAAALGFASIENVGYIAHQYSHEGLLSASSTFVFRALLSVPGHVLFSSLWGYALGRAKFQPRELRARTIVLGLLLSMLGHALFNLFLIVGLSFVLFFLLLPYLWKRLNRNVDDLLAGSPFKVVSSTTSAASASEAKAKEFFLAGSGEDTVAPESLMLPESVQCPACAANLDLTLSERRRGAYICPSCNTFNQSGEPAEILQKDSESTDEPLLQEGVSTDRVAVVGTEEEETALHSKALPEILDCGSCGREFELSVAERNRGWSVCPACNFYNAALMPSKLDRILSEVELEPGRFKLKPYVVCPSCGIELEISAFERQEAEFVCPECGIRTEAENSNTISNIRQYLLPAEVACPACEKQIVIKRHLRNQTRFKCPNCDTAIDYVEE